MKKRAGAGFGSFSGRIAGGTAEAWSFVPFCGRKGFFFYLYGVDWFVNYEKESFVV